MNELIKIINNLAIPDSEKGLILSEAKSMGKKLALFEFKYNRTVVDKAAITNVLNATIKELEQQKAIIELSKNEIARNLEELDHQRKITENKNAELASAIRTLEDAQSQLVQAEKMASLGQLTAGVAHEINNPINFVSGNIEPMQLDLDDLIEVIRLYDKVVKEKGLEPDFAEVQRYKNKIDVEFTINEIRDLLKGIEDGARRTAEIVKGLKNFSRLDNDVFKKANLNEGVDSTLTILQSVSKNKVEFVKDYRTSVAIDCLPGQINQVFMNIISNAIQAIPDKGTIYITTMEVEDAVKVSIRDTGPGIPKEIISKIFDPFFTTKEVGKGTGLGLSISYGIIEKHKGKLEVFSELNAGTEFIITLPITQEL